MGITTIVSFTNMSKFGPVQLSTTEDPAWACHTSSAGAGITRGRDDSGQCCNMRVPWCTSASEFPRHHIELRGGDGQVYDIWQENQADGDFVRYSTGGYANPGSQILGSAQVIAGYRDCGLTIDKSNTITLWDRDPTVEIPYLPDHLHHEHMEWHLRGVAKPHTGTEFLQFHRDFLAAFHAWYDVQPFADQARVAAWTALPPEFHQPQDAEAETFFKQVADLNTNLSKWATEDALGTFLKGSLHRWLHHIPITTVYRDTLITNFNDAPRTRHFYQLHGLIDHWWQRWTDAHHQAVFVSHEGIPSSIENGQPFTATVTMRNTGSFPWPRGGAIRLGSVRDSAVWGATRIGLGSAVTPNTTVAFTISATAPRTTGTYGFQWRMVDEAVEWFGDPTPLISVTVRLPNDLTVVPAVVGMSRGEAFAEIRDAGLTPAATGGGSRVASQTPGAGAQVVLGTTVTCRLRGGKPDLL